MPTYALVVSIEHLDGPVAVGWGGTGWTVADLQLLSARPAYPSPLGPW